MTEIRNAVNTSPIGIHKTLLRENITEYALKTALTLLPDFRIGIDLPVKKLMLIFDRQSIT